MPSGEIAARLRDIVHKRARGFCEYCRSQERFSVQAYSVQHIIPPETRRGFRAR